MNKLHFITSSQLKFSEADLVLDNVNLVKINIHLDEIQSDDSRLIVIEKAKEAAKKTGYQKFIVEDVSVYINALNGFPGPYIKFMEISMGIKKMAEIMRFYKDRSARIVSRICYYENGKPIIFEGITDGSMADDSLDIERLEPTCNFEHMFIPDNHNKTLSAMDWEEKLECSYRVKALNKLYDRIKNNK